MEDEKWAEIEARWAMYMKRELIEDIAESGILDHDTQAIFEDILDTGNFDALTIRTNSVVITDYEKMVEYNEMVGKAERKSQRQGALVGVGVGVVLALILPASLPVYVQIAIPGAAAYLLGEAGGQASYKTITSRTGDPMPGVYTEFEIEIHYGISFQGTRSSGAGAYGEVKGMIGPGVQSTNPLNHTTTDYLRYSGG